MKISPTSQCPCHSGQPYKSCCQPFHKGKNPATPVQLMRSRYSAYALALVGYIIKTTHPDSPFQENEMRQWRKRLQAYCARTQYIGLKILDEETKGDHATVTFRAMILDRGVDRSFTEKSAFERVKGRWLYIDIVR